MLKPPQTYNLRSSSNLFIKSPL